MMYEGGWGEKQGTTRNGISENGFFPTLFTSTEAFYKEWVNIFFL